MAADHERAATFPDVRARMMVRRRRRRRWPPAGRRAALAGAVLHRRGPLPQPRLRLLGPVRRRRDLRSRRGVPRVHAGRRGPGCQPAAAAAGSVRGPGPGLSGDLYPGTFLNGMTVQLVEFFSS